MKLIAVLSLESYQEDLHKLFAEIRIPVFSEMPISGFRVPEEDETISGWFAHRKTGIYSNMQFAFVPGEQAAQLMEAIEKFNQEKGLKNPVHAMQMNVEKFV